MPIKTECPQCGKVGRVADLNAGKRVKCPSCQSVIDVPSVERKRAGATSPAKAIRAVSSTTVQAVVDSPPSTDIPSLPKTHLPASSPMIQPPALPRSASSPFLLPQALGDGVASPPKSPLGLYEQDSTGSAHMTPSDQLLLADYGALSSSNQLAGALSRFFAVLWGISGVFGPIWILGRASERKSNFFRDGSGIQGQDLLAAGAVFFVCTSVAVAFWLLGDVLARLTSNHASE